MVNYAILISQDPAEIRRKILAEVYLFILSLNCISLSENEKSGGALASNNPGEADLGSASHILPLDEPAREALIEKNQT